MRVFIAVATASEQHVKSLKSCFELERRKGDDLFFPDQFGPGLMTRVAMEEAFWEKKQYDAILFLDGDQYHPVDMLEKLRESMEAQDLDMVCAHYYRRSTSPIESLCFELGDGTYPFQPMLHIPREGLHEIAMTGLGCVLIQRRVVAAVRKMLPPGECAFGPGAIPGVAEDHGLFGQDFRFFILARQAGYKLWLRADVESLHSVTLWLGREVAEKLANYEEWADKAQKLFEEERLRIHGVNTEAFRQRQRILEARYMKLRKQVHEAQAARNTPEGTKRLADLSEALLITNGRILEISAWLEWSEKYPKIERPDQLPTTENTAPMENVEKADAPRYDLYKENAMEMIAELPGVGGS